MPREARVLIAEDNPDWRADMEQLLKKAGHAVVGVATRRAEALALAEQIPDLQKQYGERGVVYVLGGRLDDVLTPSFKQGSDSQAVLNSLREHNIDVPTVGMSGDLTPGVTVDVTKLHLDQLVDVVTRL